MSIAIFHHPEQQIADMRIMLQQELGTEIADELIAFAQIKSKQKYDAIFHTLIQRVNRIDDIYKTKTESKQEYFERMQQFLAYTNPMELMNELENTLTFTEIKQEYNAVIQFFSKELFGDFFKRYHFDEKAFAALEAGVLSDIDVIMSNLEDYATAFAEHMETMEAIKKSSGSKTAFKVGAKIFGSVLLGPLGSVGGGAIANALTNEDDKISNSYREVLDAWGEYLDGIDQFLLTLRTRYEQILLSIIGGLFVRVSQDLKTIHIYISDLTLKNFGIEYSIVKEEVRRLQKWMEKTGAGIEAKIKNKEYQPALQAADQLFQYVEQHPLLKYELYNKQQGFYYMACLYKFAAISAYARSKQANMAEYASIVHSLFSHLPILLQEEDLEKLGLPTPFELTSTALAFYLKQGTFQKTAIFPEYLLKMIERLKTAGYYDGEATQNDQFTHLVTTIGKYLHQMHDQKAFVFYVKEVFVPIPKVKLVMNCYQSVTGQQDDELIDFMKSMIFSAKVGYFVYYLKQPAVYLSLAAVILITTLWFTKDSWLLWLEKPAEVSIEETPATISIQLLSIDADAANIRDQASLNSNVIYTAYRNEEFEIIGEQTDSEDRIWYHIEVSNDLQGWVSSKIVQLK